MLLRFEVSNHRSVKEPIELSLIAVDDDRTAVRSFDRLSEKVLTVAGIYGPNASGKSTVLESIAWLSDGIASSLRSWSDGVPREPFRFDGWPERPTTFEVDMMVDDVRHSYYVELDGTAISSESLYSFPEKRRRLVFERTASDYHVRRGLGSAVGTRELLTPSTFALSAATRLGEPEIAAFGRRLAGIGVLGLRPRGHGRRLPPRSDGAARSTRRIFAEPTQNLDGRPTEDEWLRHREDALALLRFADLGINDVSVVRDEVLGRSSIQLVHRTEDQALPFDLDEESEGTRTWFRLIGPVLGALRSGQVLLLDEIDASLHPQLSSRLLDLFLDPKTNPGGAQLIFTTHDTSLLNHLNRDEVWLTEKGPDGATSLTALAEYGGDKVRRSLNLEKAYLQGRFGAVPTVDQVMLRRVLGPAAGEQ